MTQNIVVAYDGSEYSERALDWAIERSKEWQQPLRIVLSTGLQNGVDQSFYGMFAQALQEESERIAKHAVEKARTAGVTAQGIIERGDAAGAIIHEAQDAAMVVMGKRGHHGVRGRLGSVSAAVASHAPAPVVILPGRWNPEARESRPEGESFAGCVVVGVDKLGLKNAAVPAAARHAQRRGFKLVVVSVVPTTSSLTVNSRELERAVREQLESPAKELTEAVAQQLREDFPGLDITSRVLAGRPADALVDASRTASLVVMGTRGYGGFRGLLMGSVSQAVLADTESPVMVVPTRRS